MDLGQFFTSADLIGIAPEIILTITALSILTLEMFRVSRTGIILLVAAIGLLLAVGTAVNIGGDKQFLFGGMLVLSRFSVFFDFLYISIGLITLIFSQGYLEKINVMSPIEI